MSTVGAIEPGAPPQVREGDPAAARAYTTALQFEQMLVGELSQSLVQGSGLADESAGEGQGGAQPGGEAGGASGVLSSLVPQALGESIMRGEGLGLAGELTRSLDAGLAASARRTSSDSGGEPGPGAEALEAASPAGGSPAADAQGGVAA